MSCHRFAANKRKNVAQCEAASEQYALDTANKFIELGLADLGYEYVNIDDCWSTKDLDGSGKLVPDPNKWPRGVRPVADEIHDMGLKLGLYGCVGSRTCADYPGSEGNEATHVGQLVEWDVDFWKVDNCYTPCLDQPDPQTCGRPAGHTRDFYTPMRDAIVAVQDTKPILFNLCQWGRDSVWEWGADYGNSWRMSTDNWQDWESVVRIGSSAAGISEYSAPGGWNDLDMLVSTHANPLHDQKDWNHAEIITSRLWATEFSQSLRSACTLACGRLQSLRWCWATT